MAKQDHQYNPLDLLDIDIRRFERQQAVHKDFTLRRRQDTDLLKVGNVAPAVGIEPLVLELVVDARAVSGLTAVVQGLLLICQPVQPVERALDLRVAEAGRVGEVRQDVSGGDEAGAVRVIRSLLLSPAVSSAPHSLLANSPY